MSSHSIQIKYNNIIQTFNLSNISIISLSNFFNTQVDYLIDTQEQVYLPTAQGTWENLDENSVYIIKSKLLIFIIIYY